MEKLHIQPSEIDRLPYYEYEYTIEAYQEILEERNNDSKRQQDDYSKQYNINSMQNKAMKNAKSSMPKIPSIGGLKMPRL